MPELPEVHTITKDLLENVVGYSIRKCKITQGYVALPSNETFINAVSNQNIKNVERISKNILLHLGSDMIIHFHLAMTGQILLKTFEDITSNNWLRVLLEIEKDENTKYLMFNDMRMFGKIAIINQKQREILFKKYGPEPINETIPLTDFIQKLTSKRTAIKNALLDQSLISGLGNIYATDALYLAGINPETCTKDLNENEYKKLLESAKQILNEGIQHRGSTLEDKKYVDIFGNSGIHQEHFRIYSKQVCPKCNSKVVVKKIVGRSAYFCPTCQPIKNPSIPKSKLIKK